MENVLIHQKFNTPMESIPFSKIESSHFLPALTNAIEENLKSYGKLKEIENPNFENFVIPFEAVDRKLGLISGVFHNLYSAHSNDQLREIAVEFNGSLTKYNNDILLDEGLFQSLKSVHDNQEIRKNLNSEQTRLLDEIYKDFVRNGAELNEEDKTTLRKIDEEMSGLRVKFNDNVLNETNSYHFHVTKEEELKGLPGSLTQSMKKRAEAIGLDGGWAITLDFPTFVPFMKYAENRELRKEIFYAFAKRCFQDNDKNNSEIVKRMAILRRDRAKLLGFDTHASYVLEKRMAETPNKVMSFLDELYQYAYPKAKEELNELQKMVDRLGGPNPIEKWDSSFYSEKLKQEKLNFDDEKLRPYFKLENVIDGVFKVAEKLFGLSFKERKDIEVYHEDVKAFEVTNDKNELVGLFYADFFPRESKQPGAWMTEYRGQYREGGVDHRPHVAIVCNFTPSTQDHPSLLTHGEVTTLFHEFGHALHGLISKCEFSYLAGTSVYWDFVELPSQIMENWAYEPECLDLFASHYKTGEKMPRDLIEALKKSTEFQEGKGTLAQLSYGLLDMAWHNHKNPSEISDISAFESEANAKTDLYPKTAGTNRSVSFGHLFGGGYSAGYYSYKWAEVLDADAFESFKEAGIFNTEVSHRFRDEILAKGGSAHPSELYKNFKGRDPSVKPLLKRAGLI